MYQTTEARRILRQLKKTHGNGAVMSLLKKSGYSKNEAQDMLSNDVNEDGSGIKFADKKEGRDREVPTFFSYFHEHRDEVGMAILVMALSILCFVDHYTK